MWSVCISKSLWSSCISFSGTDDGLCIYHLFVWSNLNFLHNSQWIIFPTQSCHVLHSFCANLLHSLIMWLIVSSLSATSGILLRLVFSCYDIVSSYSVYYYYYYCSLIRAFHISDSRWFFTEVWVTVSLLKSPGLFLVFWQFPTMLSFGWSPLVRQPPSPLVPLVIP